MMFPPQNETLVYDQGGNLKEDARWLYTWDGENRLTAMEEKQIANSSLGQTTPARKRLEFAYDSQSRRVRKVVKVLQGQTWSVTSDLRFVYDAWNMIAEFSLQNSALILQRSYAWGYDLSGTEQGAGGVGGLVLVRQQPQAIANNSNPPQTGALAPCYDGNGNILAYLDCPTGNVTQRMEYDAFGNEMTLDSVLTGNNTFVREVPFRFSTKYADTETNLSYYGYRYYSAEFGRWLSRDPIGERGGANLYAIVTNQGPNLIDVLGLSGMLDALKALSFSNLVGRALQELQTNCSDLSGKTSCSLCCFAIGQLRMAISLAEGAIGVAGGGAIATGGVAASGTGVGAAPGAGAVAAGSLIALISLADAALGAYDSYKDFDSCIKGICKCTKG